MMHEVNVRYKDKKGKSNMTHFKVINNRVPDRTSHVVRVVNLSLVPTRMKHAHTPGKSLGDRRQTDPAVILGHLVPPPS
jgi:hypothetical protein